jgi:hypothetical protein
VEHNEETGMEYAVGAGVGAVFAAALRPMVKTIVKSGMWLRDQVAGGYEEAMAERRPMAHPSSEPRRQGRDGAPSSPVKVPSGTTTS